MNLNNYDCITEKLNKTKTWVDIHKKLLLSREIKYRPYTCLLKRYNIKNNTYSYFIALLDNPQANKICKSTILDDYGRFKLSLSDIWKKTYLNELKSNCNIMCELVESDEDGDVYSIDV